MNYSRKKRLKAYLRPLFIELDFFKLGVFENFF